ncbi:MAG: AAA family ATPase [Luteolibacter sp.]|nr:AAA family ATPase [Luteolibacter sp.]
MKHTFFLAASGAGVGLTSVCLGVVRALDRRGIRVGFCKPISQNHSISGECDTSALFIQSTMGKNHPIPYRSSRRMITSARSTSAT